MTTAGSNFISGITTTVFATTDVVNKTYVDANVQPLPSQTGNAGEFLITTDGTSLSWDYVSNYQEFTTPGISTFTVPSYANVLFIEATGAGGGGGGGNPSFAWYPISGYSLFPTLWYDASDSSTVTLSGGTVSVWANKGSAGTSYNLTPFSAQASRQPAYTATQNGLNVMTYDGVDDQMMTTQLNSVTHIFVASVWSAAGASSTNYKGFLSSNSYDWHGDAAANLVSNVYAAGWVKSQPTQSTSQLDGSNFVNITNSKWTTFSVYSINLQSGYTGGFSGTGTANGDGRQFQGDYGEILVYQNTYLTTDQINIITGYLAWKWGSQSLLPVSHPYKNSAPSFANVDPTAPGPNLPASKGGSSGSYTSWYVPKSIVTSNITVNPGIGGVGAATSAGLGAAGAGTTVSWTGPGGTYTLTAAGGGAAGVAGTAQAVSQSSSYYTTAGLSGGGGAGAGFTATSQTNQFQPTGGGAGAGTTTSGTGGDGGVINVYGISTSASGGNSSGSNGSAGIAYTGLPYGSGGGGGGAGLGGPPTNPWTLRTSGFGANAISALVYANNTYVGGSSSGVLNTSTDTITWTLRTSGFSSSDIRALTFGNNTYLAAGVNGVLNNSTDAITWILRTTGFGAETIGEIVFGNNTYVATSSTGASALRTSTDTINWTARTASFSASIILALTFANNTYLAGGASGVLNTSTNAIVWILRTSGTTLQLNSFIFANNTYIAAGNSGVLNTSTDSIAWTLRTASVAVSIDSLTFGNNTYVAASATIGRLNTSTDAIVWILRTSSFGSNGINALTFGNSTYVAGGASGTLSTSLATSISGSGGNGARGGGGGGGASDGSTFGNGGNGGDGYVKITWW